MRLCKYCRRGKAISCNYSECVSKAYLTNMQSACAVLYYVFRVRLRHIFSHNLLKEKNFREEAIEYKMPFLIFYTYSFRKSDFILNSVCLL
jgi:hypothetical protein